MKRCLIIFAKEPEAGKVKTRLRRCLSDSKLLGLYKVFIKDTVETAKKVDCEEKILAYASKQRPLFLKRIARGFRFYKQRGKDLGLRMHNAFAYAKSAGADKTVIIGSDSPTLPSDVIRKAFYKLNRYDVVLGPATDGGYYLVGLKEPCIALFRDMRWSHNGVLSKTLQKALNLGKRTTQLDKWYDVDDRDSLACLMRDLAKKNSGNTADYTRKYLDIRKGCKDGFRLQRMQ